MQKTTIYDAKRVKVGVKSATTSLTDKHAIDEMYIEVYRHHPYLTKLMVSRLSLLGWTMQEIIGGKLEGSIFLPKLIFSFSTEIELQGYPLERLGNPKKFWKQLCLIYIRSSYPHLLGKGQKNNRISYRSVQR